MSEQYFFVRKLGLLLQHKLSFPLIPYCDYLSNGVMEFSLHMAILVVTFLSFRLQRTANSSYKCNLLT